MKIFLQILLGFVIIYVIMCMFQLHFYTQENILSRVNDILLDHQGVAVAVYIPFFSYLYHTNKCYAEVFINDGDTRLIEFNIVGIMFLEKSTILIKRPELMKLAY